MKTRVVPFHGGHLGKDNFPPLSPKMIVALVAALEKQNKKIPFGPTSIKGSLTSLIERGLIVHKKITLNGRVEFSMASYSASYPNKSCTCWSC